ncbi:MAG: hypothetical protein MUO72_09760 [Bacteroidales bacterium]|nr:hypothetical protein [Bacteroidales bacterium]
MNKRRKYYTDFLTANSFVIGLGSVFNIAGNYFIYNSSESAEEADLIALTNDWYVIGQDIDNALTFFDKENKSQKQLVIPFVD